MRYLKKLQNFSAKKHAEHIEHLYEKYEHSLMPLAMLVGITVDFIAFRRIDLFFENIVLLIYLGTGAIGITLVNLYEGGIIKGKLLDRLRLWLPLIIQFSFGGLFSAFVVFYVKSASFITSWPFLLILIAMVIGNEFFRKKYIRLTFHMSIYFLALYSFAIFYLPIIFKRIDTFIFVLSGVLSIGLISLFTYLLSKAIPQRIALAKNSLIVSIGSIFLLINIFYITNIIPPIPLALKEGGVYHDVSRTQNVYTVVEEEKKWYEFLLPYESIHVHTGEPVYIFSAIFAPTDLRNKVRHHWQYRDETGSWITTDKLEYEIIGGRDGGYRGYSYKRQTFPGNWRVDIETENGQVIGRIRFKILRPTEQVTLQYNQY